MPKTPFLNMFGRSPIRPLEEHMAIVHSCVKELLPFFQAVLATDWQMAHKVQKTIVSLEHKADNLKRELRLHLPNSLFMSFSRSDILALLNVQDQLANKAKDIAGVVLGREMLFPKALSTLFLAYVKRNIEASEQANKAIHELDELLETGFSGNEIKLVDSMILLLSEIENDTDQAQVQLRHEVLGLEEVLPPVQVMFLYKIIEWIGDLADHAKEVGDDLQILLAR